MILRTKAMMLLSSAVLMVGLSACGTSTPAPAPATTEPVPPPIQVSEKYVNTNTFEITKKLKDGRTVTCVVWQEYQEGGMSCDWESVTKKPSK